MTKLNELKKRLLGESPSDQEEINDLCRIMEICGGYEQLMNLPLSSLKHIGEYIKKSNQQIEKGMRVPNKR